MAKHVVGNGPSAITLSYLLSGNVPFYKGGCEDVYVDKKLSRDEPIVLQDIEYLSQVRIVAKKNPIQALIIG